MTADQVLAGEEDIIQGYLAPLAAGMPGAFGLRDDCATAAPSPGCEFVLKTDAIASGVHFLPDDPSADIGWKALAVNVSDLAAKGARPHGYLMSLAFPAAPTRDWMAEFARGLADAQRAFGIGLLGGDTDKRPGPLTITPMVIGEVPVGRMVRRGTARAGDILCVSGTLGDSALGLSLRQDATLGERWRLSSGDRDALVARFLRPQPRVTLASVVLAHARASMDISDGLMKDLGRMCRASGVGADVDYAKLPLSSAFRSALAAAPDAAGHALFAGDDYELLCAVPWLELDACLAAAEAAGVPFSPIGVFTERRSIALRSADGRILEPAGAGWDHF